MNDTPAPGSASTLAPLTADDLAAIKARSDRAAQSDAHGPTMDSQADVPDLFAHVEAQADRIATLEAQHTTVLALLADYARHGSIDESVEFEVARALGVTS